MTAEQTFASLIESSLLAAGRSVRVTNVGIGGERTDQALTRLQKVLALQPDVVTIMYGTNDSYVDKGKAASRLSRDRYRDNLVRLVTGSDHRIVVPCSALAGGSLLIISDTLARTVMSPRQLPVGAITALVGVPLFLILLRRSRAPFN